MSERGLHRDRLTWLVFAMAGYYSFLLNALGPLLPFLRAEFGFSHTIGSLYFGTFALGMIAAGTVGDQVVRHLGRRRTFWVGGLGLAAGALILATGKQAPVTIGGALLMGTLGSLVLVVIPAALAARHGTLSAAALAEAGVVGSVCGTLAPLAIGWGVRTGWGWRGGMALAPLILVLLVVLGGRVDFPIGDQSIVTTVTTRDGHLSGTYWAYWTTIVIVVAIEFALLSWGTEFLANVAHLQRATAAATMSLFLWGMTLGRLAGSWLARQITPARLLRWSLGLAAGGFSFYWLAPAPPLTIAGLFLAGLGVANLYPLSLALAVGAAPGQRDAAAARAAFASGAAILGAPLVLGWLADHVGLQPAYGVVLILLVAAWLLGRADDRQGATQARHETSCSHVMCDTH